MQRVKDAPENLNTLTSHVEVLLPKQEEKLCMLPKFYCLTFSLSLHLHSSKKIKILPIQTRK